MIELRINLYVLAALGLTTLMRALEETEGSNGPSADSARQLLSYHKLGNVLGQGVLVAEDPDGMKRLGPKLAASILAADKATREGISLVRLLSPATAGEA